MRSIDVREGQAVKAGQLLARLDPTFAAADAGALTAQVSSLEAEVARLQAEADGKPFNYTGIDPALALQASIYDIARRSDRQAQQLRSEDGEPAGHHRARRGGGAELPQRLAWPRRSRTCARSSRPSRSAPPSIRCSRPTRGSGPERPGERAERGGDGAQGSRGHDARSATPISRAGRPTSRRPWRTRCRS